MNIITIGGFYMNQKKIKFSFCEKVELFFTKIMKNAFFIKDGVLKKYIGKDKTVSIPDGVTHIGEAAFSQCKDIESVYIPDSVTSIGESAFEGCVHLKSVNIPDGIIEIKERTFWGCLSLESIIIPKSVISIGAYAFCECSNLKSITIPGSIPNIGNAILGRCTKLQSIIYKDDFEVVFPLLKNKNIDISGPSSAWPFFSIKIFLENDNTAQQDFEEYIQLLKQTNFYYDAGRINVIDKNTSSSEEFVIKTQMWTGRQGNVLVNVMLMADGYLNIENNITIGDTYLGEVFRRYIKISISVAKDNKK